MATREQKFMAKLFLSSLLVGILSILFHIFGIKILWTIIVCSVVVFVLSLIILSILILREDLDDE